MNVKNISDDDLEKLIAEKYGDDWDIDKIDPSDELIKEFTERISKGV